MIDLSTIRPNLYPTNLVAKCSTGLCLFGAGFYGANDSIHMLDLEKVHVIDIDAEKLVVMKGIYPETFTFAQGDVFEYAKSYSTAGMKWDIVSVDAPTNLFKKVIILLDDFVKLASKYCVITTYDYLLDEFEEAGYQVIDVIDRNRHAGTVLAVVRV